MNPGSEEGWFTDPYGRYEARWMSNGQATKLVRDGDLESYDEVPDGPSIANPVRVTEGGAGGGDGADLRRADDAERGQAFDAQRFLDAAEEGIDGAPGF